MFPKFSSLSEKKKFFKISYLRISSWNLNIQYVARYIAGYVARYLAENVAGYLYRTYVCII